MRKLLIPDKVIIIFALGKLDVWVCYVDFLQPVDVTKVCVHVKNGVVVTVLHETAIYLSQHSLPVKSKGILGQGARHESKKIKWQQSGTTKEHLGSILL